MKLGKHHLIAAATSAALGIGTLGIGVTFAAEPTAEPVRNHIAQVIASRFQLNVDEVQKVLDEEHQRFVTEHKEKMQGLLAERLAKGVETGKITEAQAKVIAQKLKELHELRPELKDLSPEERQEAIKTQRDALRAWAQENGIPENFLHPRAPFSARKHK